MDVNMPVQVIMTAIKRMDDPDKAFYKILKVAEEAMPSKVWGRLGYDLKTDVESARQWLQTEMSPAGDFTGIYLGLDTQNMDDGDGSNVEIAFSKTCDIDNPKSEEWLNDLDVRGSSHLIRGLYDMEKIYGNEDKYKYELRSFAQYVIFLGYSGVVLGAALGRLEHPGAYLAQWGYHDGDMFCLARKSGAQLTLIPE